ncbi:MAG: universal stress protein [Gemmatimonadaceae bacterium]
MRIASVVVGMDFSDTAVESAAWVADHFAPDAAMTLIHVIAPLDQPAYAGHLVPSSQAFEAVAREYADTHLREVADSLAGKVVRREVRVGKPYEEITRIATEIDADLIIVGPHGDRPRSRPFLGTTAERVVRTSRLPVLVVANPPAGVPRHILAAVDDAAITETLLAWTRDLAAEFDADVHLLHVWSEAIYSHVASMSYATTATEAGARIEIAAELHDAALHWLRELARTGVPRGPVTATVTHGKAGDATLASAAAIPAALIAMARRGRGLAPALLGSTVRTVLHAAPCPVLVVVAPSESKGESA